MWTRADIGVSFTARNVADLVRPPKAPHLEMLTYTPEQANQLLDAAKAIA
jgi:hypothetical protein